MDRQQNLFLIPPQREAKVQLFREAVEAYSELTAQVNHSPAQRLCLMLKGCPLRLLCVPPAQAFKGHGIDRHLLGLKLQAIEEGYSIPKVFMDTAYGVATHWKLRTGQVRGSAGGGPDLLLMC